MLRDCLGVPWSVEFPIGDSEMLPVQGVSEFSSSAILRALESAGKPRGAVQGHRSTECPTAHRFLHVGEVESSFSISDLLRESVPSACRCMARRGLKSAVRS